MFGLNIIRYEMFDKSISDYCVRVEIEKVNLLENQVITWEL